METGHASGDDDNEEQDADDAADVCRQFGLSEHLETGKDTLTGTCVYQ